MTKDMTTITLDIDAGLWTAIKELARKYGVRGNFVVRRSLIYTIHTGKIYWPTDGDSTEEKQGRASTTPVYDAEEKSSPKPSGSGQKARASRAQ